jgi:hypothetical protein
MRAGSEKSSAEKRSAEKRGGEKRGGEKRSGEKRSACMGPATYLGGLKALTQHQNEAWAVYVAPVLSNRQRMDAACGVDAPFGALADRLAPLLAMRRTDWLTALRLSQCGATRGAVRDSVWRWCTGSLSNTADTSRSTASLDTARRRGRRMRPPAHNHAPQTDWLPGLGGQ